MNKIRELGMELVENVENSHLQQTEESNIQALHAKFKKNVESYVHSYARTITLKLDKQIERKERALGEVLNNETADPAERQMLSAMLDEELQG